jgi:hypothetical protein
MRIPLICLNDLTCNIRVGTRALGLISKPEDHVANAEACRQRNRANQSDHEV